MKKGLSLSGGGILGAAQAGMLSQAFEFGEKFIKYKAPCNYWQTVAGTSIGAVNGLLIALGYTADEIYDIWQDINKGKIARKNWLPFQAVYDRTPMKKFIENLVKQKSGKLDINFSELYELNQVKLICFASVIQTGKVLSFSKDALNCSVVDAILMSSAFPIMFEPVEFIDASDGKTYQAVDGGTLTNMPILPLIEDGCEHITVLSVGNLDTNFRLNGRYLLALSRLLKFITIGNEFVSIALASYMMKNNLEIYHCTVDPTIDIFDWDKILYVVQAGVKSWDNGPVNPKDLIEHFSNYTNNSNEAIKQIIFKG